MGAHPESPGAGRESPGQDQHFLPPALARGLAIATIQARRTRIGAEGLLVRKRHFEPAPGE